MKILTEEDIKKELRHKYQNKEFKFDKRTNQKFIEIVNAHFESVTGYIVYHDHHITNEQWYIDYYEPLLGNQIDNAIEAIKEDPDTRQAYIGMLIPDKYSNGDKICTIGMQFIYNKDTKQLDDIVYMRSNNVCEYSMDSLWQVKIYERVINRLISELDDNICPGHIYWNVGSLHLYEEDFKFLSDKTKIANEIKYLLNVSRKLGKNIKDKK